MGAGVSPIKTSCTIWSTPRLVSPTAWARNSPAVPGTRPLKRFVRCARPLSAATRATGEAIPKTCPTFRDDSSIRYDAHTYKLKSLDRVSLYTLSGRVIGQVALGDFQRTHLYDMSWKIGGAELIRRGSVWYLCITQTKADPAPTEPTGWLGVDLGMVNLATDSEGASYSGEQIDRVRTRYAGRRRALQPIKTKSAKRHLKRLSGKQRRFQKDMNHRISKRLVATAKRTGRGIALEDLKGIRERVRVRGAAQRARHSNWAFGQLRQFVSYKAQRAGVRVVAVDPRHTSQRCSACGHTERANRRSQAQFCCVVCHFATSADYNAALNIERAAVNQPRAGQSVASARGLRRKPPALAGSC